MLSNRQSNEDGQEYWTVTINCHMDECENIQVHKMFSTKKLVLPNYTSAASAVFKKAGWRIGKAHPKKRFSVIERDDLDKPTKTAMIDSTAIGDLCPSCASKVHPK